jgi:hypothetical protein
VAELGGNESRQRPVQREGFVGASDQSADRRRSHGASPPAAVPGGAGAAQMPLGANSGADRRRPPGEADAERTKADLQDGVLTVRVPKPDGSRGRQIQVKGE